MSQTRRSLLLSSTAAGFGSFFGEGLIQQAFAQGAPRSLLPAGRFPWYLHQTSLSKEAYVQAILADDRRVLRVPADNVVRQLAMIDVPVGGTRQSFVVFLNSSRVRLVDCAQVNLASYWMSSTDETGGRYDLTSFTRTECYAGERIFEFRRADGTWVAFLSLGCGNIMVLKGQLMASPAQPGSGVGSLAQQCGTSGVRFEIYSWKPIGVASTMRSGTLQQPSSTTSRLVGERLRIGDRNASGIRVGEGIPDPTPREAWAVIHNVSNPEMPIRVRTGGKNISVMEGDPFVVPMVNGVGLFWVDPKRIAREFMIGTELVDTPVLYPEDGQVRSSPGKRWAVVSLGWNEEQGEIQFLVTTRSSCAVAFHHVTRSLA